MRLIKKLIILFTFLISGIKAQTAQSVIIDKVNTKDLSNQFISSLFHDDKGYLWVGTIGGLNKYNGYTFVKYRSFQNDTNSLSNPAITCFYQEDINNIFVGTRNGLNIYHYTGNNFSRVKLNNKNPNYNSKNNIYCIVSNNSGEKLIGTANGILKYNKQTNTLDEIKNNNKTLLEGWTIHSMCIDRLGNLWAGAKNNDAKLNINKVFKYEFKTEKLIDISVQENSSAEHCGISEDYLGNIWVAITDGLASINPGTYKISYYKAPENFYSNVSYTHAKDNTIWQCYWSFGVTSFDIDKKEFKIYKNDPSNENSLMSNKCWALLKDDNDILWIGSDVGLQKITNKRPGIEVIRKNNQNEKNSFKGNIVTAVLASRNQNNIVFAGIDGEGFSIYNRLTKDSKNFGPNSENKNEERFVNQFIEDTNGDLYILGQNNFQKLSFNNNQITSKAFFGYQEHYSACGTNDPFNKNILWIGGKGEIMRFDRSTQQTTFIRSPLGVQAVFYTTFISNNHVYFGFKNGLIELDPKNNKLEKIDLPEVGAIHCALVLNKEEVLMSSQYLGIIKFNPVSKKIEILHKEKNELFSEPSFLLTYKNNIWLSGNGGLTALNPSNGEIREISTNDGLPSQIVHKADLLDGYFYLATHEGLAIINPDMQVSHFISPKIDVTGITVLTDSTFFGNLNSGDKIVLSEKQNSIKINFSVLDFNLPEKNRFKFKLSPIQKEWQSPVGENFLIFNSLPSGTYKFELLGSNSDQIWSTEPFILEIKIVPPFYKSRWFIVLILSISVIGGLSFIYLRIRSDHKKQVMLEKVIKERTAEIQTQRAELLDSITYARRIQKAIFVGQNELSDNLKESFIYCKPKDKLSGDLYWIGRFKDMLIVFAGDCTGHGVPGAMLSIVGTSLLNKIVHEEDIYLPGEILTRLNYLFYNQLSLGVENVRDGMDASVITINLVNRTAYFAGAKLDGVCVVNNKMTDLKAQRTSIGEKIDTEYTTQQILNEADRCVYLFSDGMKDQYGGLDEKKLGTKRFKEILHQASVLPIEEQKSFIYETINNWKASLPQTDDMILIGLKF